MFCSICQKSFKADKMYKLHLKSNQHLREEQRFNENPYIFRKKIGCLFVEHFLRFIGSLEEFTEINKAYCLYISANKYRIKGSLYKTLEECISEMEKYAQIKTQTGKTFVKKLETKAKENEVLLDDLIFY
jgi:Zinc-finger of C2H2 type